MKKKVLFICSQNKFRSATAHEIFRHSESIEADSAGTEADAKVRTWVALQYFLLALLLFAWVAGLASFQRIH